MCPGRYQHADLQVGWWRLRLGPGRCGLSVAGAELTGAAGLSLQGCVTWHRQDKDCGILLLHWLSKGRREGRMPGSKRNGVMGAGWHLGAGPGHGLPGVPISAL